MALEIAKESKRKAEIELGKHPGDKPRTGKLARGYRVTVVPGTNHFRVNNSKAYSDAIELGARAHRIYARRVQYLQFIGRDGRPRRVRFVNHPGNKAYLLMSRSADEVMRRTIGTFRKT